MYNLSLTPKRSQEIIQRRTASCKRHQNSDKLPAYGKHRRGLCREDCIQQKPVCGKIGIKRMKMRLIRIVPILHFILFYLMI